MPSPRNEATIEWLLVSTDPSVRYFTLTDVVGLGEDSPDVQVAREEIPGGPRVRALLDGQQPDGGFGADHYRKWTGTHWRLVSLVELGVPAGFPPAMAAAESILESWTRPEHISQAVRVISGRPRIHASQEGNALAASCRLGIASDPRTQALAERLIETQWPDGGWNCDNNPEAHHSSFHESLIPIWGLFEYHAVTGSRDALAATERGIELLLRHRLFRSERTGSIIRPLWLRLRYPTYWHYSVLQALLMLARLGRARDPRAQEALDILWEKQLQDGGWRVEGCYWRVSGRATSGVDVVDWGRRGPNEMITLNALRVLRAAGRLD